MHGSGSVFVGQGARERNLMTFGAAVWSLETLELPIGMCFVCVCVVSVFCLRLCYVRRDTE